MTGEPDPEQPVARLGRRPDMDHTLLSFTSLADWHWGETSLTAVIVLIGLLTMRGVIEHDRAIT